ncbi:MAG: hypothetical protein HC869_27505 [Rhodospirillales bacterium]|nr:hypothetical protein [Rhodospirillales bacterium]
MTAAALALALAAGSAAAQSSAPSPPCPAGADEYVFSTLAFCVPQSNQRYRFTPNGIEPMYWLGEEPIAAPSDTEALKDADVTIARAWADQSVVGTSDQASGKKGFDRFLDVVATHIMKAEKAANGAAEFAADVPTDESGLLQPFRFQRLASGVLKGVRQEPDGSESYIMLFRPAAGEAAPHLMLCGVVSAAREPAHLCMTFVTLLDQRLAITVAGKNLERSFRISEEVSRDLASLVKPPAP